jgi:CDGSH-type Zn-finger protein
MNVNVAVKAEVNQDGSVACRVTCDGQHADLTFTGTEVLISVPEPAEAP